MNNLITDPGMEEGGAWAYHGQGESGLLDHSSAHDGQFTCGNCGHVHLLLSIECDGAFQIECNCGQSFTLSRQQES